MVDKFAHSCTHTHTHLCSNSDCYVASRPCSQPASQPTNQPSSLTNSISTHVSACIKGNEIEPATCNSTSMLDITLTTVNKYTTTCMDVFVYVYVCVCTLSHLNRLLLLVLWCILLLAVLILLLKFKLQRIWLWSSFPCYFMHINITMAMYIYMYEWNILRQYSIYAQIFHRLSTMHIHTHTHTIYWYANSIPINAKFKRSSLWTIVIFIHFNKVSEHL